jgi:hypothetical protein
MKLSKFNRALISELLSVADLCKHDFKIREVIYVRTMRALRKDARGFPFMMDDAGICGILDTIRPTWHPTELYTPEGFAKYQAMSEAERAEWHRKANEKMKEAGRFE